MMISSSTNSPPTTITTITTTTTTTDEVTSRGVIDTAAPFESVKAAVSKFGGIVNWKAPKPHVTTASSSSELQRGAAAALKSVENELVRMQARVADMRRQAQDAETAKEEALSQLQAMTRLAEEMKLTLQLHDQQETQFQQQEMSSEEKEEDCIPTTGERDVAADVERAEEEVTSLRAAASSLQLELEPETVALDAARRKMAMSLEDELRRARAELLLRHDHHHQLKESTGDVGDMITLPLEQYISLCEGAEEAEKLAEERVAGATGEAEDAKASESRSLERLDEASREVEERKEALRRAAMALEEANEGKLGVEQELRAWRADNEQKRRAASSAAAAAAAAAGHDEDEEETEEEEGEVDDDEDDGSSAVIVMNHTSSNSATLFDDDDDENNPAADAAAEQMAPAEGGTNKPINDQDHDQSSSSSHSKRNNKKKKSFFPRIVMFLARKKAQSLK